MTNDVHATTSTPDWDKVHAHVYRMLRDIKVAHAHGQRKRAAYLQRQFLSSFDSRRVATSKAFDSLRPSRRPAISTLSEQASKLNAWCGTSEIVKVRWKPKASNENEFRPIMNFGIENRALQYLVVECLKAQADLHKMQFAVNGGRDAAVIHVRNALASGFSHVAEMDIRDCYMSFIGEKLAGLLPVPKEVVEQVILSRHLNLLPIDFQSGGVPQGPFVEEYLAEARQGIAQGSAASNVVAEIALATVVAQMPSRGVVVAYADNFLLMAKSSAGVVAMKKALRELLLEHPAGPLILNAPKQYKPGKAVEFLGYRMTVTDTGCEIVPTPRNLSKFQSQFSRKIKRIKADGLPSKVLNSRVVDLKSYVKSWAHGFALWPGAKQHMQEHLAIMSGAGLT